MANQFSENPICRSISVGMEFGKWRVTGDGKRKKPDGTRPNPIYYECTCECGAVRDVCYTSLAGGKSKGCGCVRNSNTSTRNMIHGGSKRKSVSPLYRRWLSIRSRCNNPNNKEFASYGGRGVSLCPEWGEYTEFENWAMSNGFDESLQIDRINNNGDYSPQNCRWTDRHTQQRNRSDNRNITAWGETKCFTDWWKHDPRCVVGSITLRKRLAKGMTPEEAMSKPAQR